MSNVISKIFREAHEKDMPLSAPGIALFTIQASTTDKFDSSKAFRYKSPYFTDVKLLTHDQLERINKIIEEKHPNNEYSNYTKKDISVMDLSKLSQKETVKIVGEFPKLGDEKAQKDVHKDVNRKPTKNNKGKDSKEQPQKTIVEISHKKVFEKCPKESCETSPEESQEESQEKPQYKPQRSYYIDYEDILREDEYRMASFIRHDEKPVKKPQRVPHKMTKKDKLLKHKNCH